MNVHEAISWYLHGKEHRIGELELDAIVSERHNFSSEITEHPVESGSVIADHIYNKPISIDLDCIITNTPMTWVGLTAFDSFQRFNAGENNDFSEIAFKKIEEIFKKREPITIATSLKSYDNMVLESLSVERGGGTSSSLHFNCAAKQIRIVDQLLVKISKAKNPRAQPKQKKGLQETKPLRTPWKLPPTRSPYWGR